ncbi:Topoisomerase 1-associated factor 1 [Gaertneriomyces sp. JEL0708]|nr:Topoisomerase 1-associated factor 1 [Gaertneriomyces sp. JEL0708]
MESIGDDVQESHLLSICSALGTLEEKEVYIVGQGLIIEKKYVLGDEVLECLRDLKRMLQNDDANPNKFVVRALGRWKILQNDLIPILLVAHQDGKDKITQAVIQIMVPLTWPLDMETTDVKGQLEHQREYKAALIGEGVLSAIMDQLVKTLSIPYPQRRDRDHAIIGLILTLFRNLLAITDVQSGASGTVSTWLNSQLQEKLLIAMDSSDALQLLLSFAGSASHRDYAEYSQILLDIFYQLFRDRDPEQLLDDNKTLSVELTEMVHIENQAKKTLKRPLQSRHPRFGGALWLEMDGQKLTTNNPSRALHSIQEAIDANKTGPRFQRKPAIDEARKKRKIKNLAAALIYERTARQFLENCFNTLILSAKRDFDMERDNIKDEHYVRFLWLCSFFLKFQLFAWRAHQKAKKSQPTLADESVDFDTVTGFVDLRGMNFVYKRIRQSRDEKKWAELHAAVECLKNMLAVLDAMNTSLDEQYRDASENIQSNMYYEHSSVETIISLLRTYTKRNLPLSYLKSLVETVHLLMKMLQEYSTEKSVIFTRKRKGGSTKRKPNEGETTGDATHPSEDEEDAIKKPAYTERSIVFSDIEHAFAYESIVDAYMHLLKHYKTLEDATIYYITVMLHRIFVKCKGESPLLYKLSILQLFNNIISDRSYLPNTDSHKELYTFINFMLSKFFKKLREYPLLFLEILYPKTKGDCRKIEFDEDHEMADAADSDDNLDKDGLPKPVRDIEVKKSVPWEQSLQVAVTLLMSSGAEHHLEWTKAKLLDASMSRLSPPSSATDKGGEGLDPEHEPYDIRPDSEEVQRVMKGDAHFRLLLSLLGLQEQRDLNGVWWTVPGWMNADELIRRRSLIDESMAIPMDDAEEARKLTRKKRKSPKRKPNSKAGAKRGKRGPAKAKEQQKYTSAEFIDSETEDENDREFLRQAQERVRKRREREATDTIDEKPFAATLRDHGHKWNPAHPTEARTMSDHPIVGHKSDSSSSSSSDSDSSSDLDSDSTGASDQDDQDSIRDEKDRLKQSVALFGDDFVNLFADDSNPESGTISSSNFQSISNAEEPRSVKGVLGFAGL